MIATHAVLKSLLLAAPDLIPILSDQELVDTLLYVADAPSRDAALRKLTLLLPKFLGPYRSNLFNILAILYSKTASDIANQTISDSLCQILALLRAD